MKVLVLMYGTQDFKPIIIAKTMKGIKKYLNNRAKDYAKMKDVVKTWVEIDKEEIEAQIWVAYQVGKATYDRIADVYVIEPMEVHA